MAQRPSAVRIMIGEDCARNWAAGGVIMKTLMQILRCRKGAVVVLMAAAVVGLTGMAALAVDAGMLYLNRYQLANAADAAALAGAQELPGRPEQAVSTASSIAAANSKPGPTPDNVQPVLSKNNTAITVTINRNVPLFFARVLGLNSSMVSATATAEVKTYTGGTNGIVPFGIVKQNFVFGQTYQLKLGGGDGYNGNFQALALGGSGASTYTNNIKYGYKGTFKIGDWIFTETGNMSGPTASGVSYRIGLDPASTFNNVSANSSRIIIVPVLDSLLVSGRSDVLVVGFAAFFLEGSGGGGNNSYVYGKFREMVVPGESNNAATYYGLSVVTLTK